MGRLPPASALTATRFSYSTHFRSLRTALDKFPKAVGRFAVRFALAHQRLKWIYFAPGSALLVKAAPVVVEMVHELHRRRLEPMKRLSDKLRVIENAPDR